MSGIMNGLGGVLQGVGTVISPSVREQQDKERNIAMNRLQQLQSQLISGVENGSVDPNMLARVGIPAGMVGPSPQAMAARAGMEADQRLRASLKGKDLGTTSEDMRKLLDDAGADSITGPMGGKLFQLLQQREAKEEAIQQRYDALSQAKELAKEKMADARLSADQRQAEAARWHGLESQFKMMDLQLKQQGLNMRGASSGSGHLDDETLNMMAEQALAGDKSVLSGLGYGNVGAQNRLALRERMAQIAKGKGLNGSDIAAKNAEFFGITAGERTLGSRTANIEMAATEAQNLAPIALSASSKVDRTQFPALNKILLAAEKGVGDENVIRAGIATNSLINVYARAINPNGVSTVHDKEHARELLETAWAKGQYGAGVDQLMQEISAARKSPGQVRKTFRDSVTEESGSSPKAIPKAGDIIKGYRFNGGDPSDKNNWEKS